MVGWDLGRLGARLAFSGRAWDFTALVEEHARRSDDMLDLGTGGGEWLSGLAHRPRRTTATESWRPNVDVARARLEPLGIAVVQVEPAPTTSSRRRGTSAAGCRFPMRPSTS